MCVQGLPGKAPVARFQRGLYSHNVSVHGCVERLAHVIIWAFLCVLIWALSSVLIWALLRVLIWALLCVLAHGCVALCECFSDVCVCVCAYVRVCVHVSLRVRVRVRVRVCAHRSTAYILCAVELLKIDRPAHGIPPGISAHTCTLCVHKTGPLIYTYIHAQRTWVAGGG